MNDNLTPEDIQRHYNAAMDSVNLLNTGKPENMGDEDWAVCVSRNVEHLKIMVVKDFWIDQDLTPLRDSIDANAEAE